MTVSFVVAMNLTRSLLNSSTTYGTNDDLERHPENEISDALIAADAEIINAIGTTPGHPHRASLVTQTPVAHAALIPDHIGPVGEVLVNGKGAEQLEKDEIEYLRTNVLGLTQISEFYQIAGDPPHLYFAPSSATATVDLVLFTQASSSLRSPDEYLFPVVNIALSQLFGKEGSEIPAAQHFKSLSDRTFDWIKAGSQGSPPEAVSAQKAA